MINALATCKLRRLPALLLVPCLLLMGALVTTAPERDGARDSMTAHAQVQSAVRAPVLRPASHSGHTPVAVPTSGSSLPQEWVVFEAREHGDPVVVLRSAPQPFHLSRAPPASA
jgi:hypothetical protein